MSSTIKQSLKKFQKEVWAYYHKHKRVDLPWRKTKDPYKILVSEIMLQQTQVNRVLPKYESFTQRWKTVQQLAATPLRNVLEEWQGLGYNRRAKMLHECTKEIVEKHAARFPKTYDELTSLPGIGPYTASAVMAFAYNKPVIMIETNIRTVYLHHFFKDKNDVFDIEILGLVEKTIDLENPREWYWALMDYGTHLKKEYGNPNSRSKHYIKQSKFHGSDRQIRGAIIKIFTDNNQPRSYLKLHKNLSQFEDIRIDAQLHKLVREGMIVQQKRSFLLPD